MQAKGKAHLQDHPRLRGNYFKYSTIETVKKGSPPLTRELLRQGGEDLATGGITPAYAGTTISASFTSKCTRDHPRLRGNYFCRTGNRRIFQGSPPLTRELLLKKLMLCLGLRITPAYAGTTASICLSAVNDQDNPRLRGNYCLHKRTNLRYSGSPPLTRELLTFQGFILNPWGITPAYAGTTYL